MILGVSKDSIKKHCSFISKYDLNFSLLADEEGAACEAYGVWVEKSMYGKKYMGISRSSFLVGADGNIEQVWEKVNTKTHAQDVLNSITGGRTVAKPAAKAPVKKSSGETQSALVKKAVALKKPAVKKSPAGKAPAKKAAAPKAPAKKTDKKK